MNSKKFIYHFGFPLYLVICMLPIHYVLLWGGPISVFVATFIGVHLAIALCWFVEKLQPWKNIEAEKGEHLTNFQYYALRVFINPRLYMVTAVIYLLENLEINYILISPMAWENTPYVATCILAVFVASFPDYWAHRFLHKNKFLWQCHATHHSTRQLYFFAGIRTHLIEFCLKEVSFFLLIYSFGFGVAEAAYWWTLRSVCGFWAHSNIDCHNPWLEKLFNSNHLHRWHHSVDDRELNCNFGVGFMFWDHVFGTYYCPSHEKSPSRMGLSYEGNFPLHSFWQQLLTPFMWSKYVDKDTRPITRDSHEVLESYPHKSNQPI